jgi:hypothetical protein
MRFVFTALPALIFTGVVVAQGDGRTGPRDPAAKVPAVEFRSAFEGYRPYVEQELRDWRKANNEVGAADGHAGHPRPQPGKPETSGRPGERSGAPAREDHGGHK